MGCDHIGDPIWCLGCDRNSVSSGAWDRGHWGDVGLEFESWGLGNRENRKFQFP